MMTQQFTIIQCSCHPYILWPQVIAELDCKTTIDNLKQKGVKQ